MEQPPSTLHCNPYYQRLSIVCRVEGPPQTFNIVWLKGSTATSGDKDANHSLKHAIVHQTNSNYSSLYGDVGFVRVSSRLSISPVSEEDIGQYWCKVLSSNGTVLAARSNILTLEREEVYNSFARCRGSNSIRRRDCATLDEPTPPPTPSTETEFQAATTVTTATAITTTTSKQLFATDVTATTSLSADTDGPVTAEEESNVPAIIVYSVPTIILVLCILATVLIFITILLRLKHQQCTAADDDTPKEGSNSPYYEVIDVDDIVAMTTAVKQTQSSPSILSITNESYDDIIPPPIVTKRRQALPGFAITNNVAYYLDPRKTVPQ